MRVIVSFSQKMSATYRSLAVTISPFFFNSGINGVCAKVLRFATLGAPASRRPVRFLNRAPNPALVNRAIGHQLAGEMPRSRIVSRLSFQPETVHFRRERAGRTIAGLTDTSGDY